ncbi:DUF2834 domain containing protein [Streptomyces microflavus DSM 40593]|uniref:DUF2834 domain containing protein n=1 Tax=Streptomyces microflavus DSM 40593 TaxID=1303692 RepID=N0CVJ4_STRMI|nr:DUF2834 domain-containing protein [Streptomyces microflavus]AGK77022.1 DUF2834 domain containing protein [Streptomyces microflavus DSM 40593]
MNGQDETERTRQRGNRTLEVVFALLLVAGIALPYAQAIPWLAENGLDLHRLIDEIFATRISSFFGWDVIVAVVVLLTAASVDTHLSKGQKALVGLGALLGASVGLPLYLLLRQRNLRRDPP